MDQNTEYPGVNHTIGANNSMPGNPPGLIPTNGNNTPKVETFDESNAEEYETEKKKQYKTRNGLSSQ